MTTKNKLLDEINKKIQRNKDIKRDKASGAIVEQYVQEFIREIEDLNYLGIHAAISAALVPSACDNLVEKIKRVDPLCNVEVSWHESNVNGVLIKWSEQYQSLNNCESETFIDVVSLYFK